MKKHRFNERKNMDTNEFESRRSAAKIRVAKMDEIDGWKNRHIEVIASALEAGIRNPGTDAHFDAMVMLEDVLEDMRRTIVDGKNP